jgi:hypothetical protein
MNAARIAAIRVLCESKALTQSWHLLVGECLDALEANERVIARLRQERDQAVLQLSRDVAL